MGELSKTVWEVATVLRLNSRYLSFGGERINGYSPLVIRTAVRGGCWQAYLDGSPMALGSTGAHEVWVKQVIPHRGPTPLTEIPLAGKR